MSILELQEHPTDLLSIRDRALKLVTAAERFTIINRDDAGHAVDLCAMVKAATKKAEAERDVLVRPLNAQVKEINGRFKPIVEPLQAAARTLEARIYRFHLDEKRKAEVEEARLRRDAAERALQEAVKAEAAGDQARVEAVLDDAADAPLPVIPVPIQTRGDYGALASTTKRWTFEITGPLHLIPDVYLLINVPAVNAAIRAGIREIPGLRIFQTESITVR